MMEFEFNNMQGHPRTVEIQKGRSNVKCDAISVRLTGFPDSAPNSDEMLFQVRSVAVKSLSGDLSLSDAWCLVKALVQDALKEGRSTDTVFHFGENKLTLGELFPHFGYSPLDKK